MKRTIFYLFAIATLLIVPTKKVTGQIGELGSFMSTGTEDAEKLLEAYISPWINGFGASLSGGWYNTAKTHKPGGFDLTITGNAAFIPSKYKTFDVNELNLGGLKLANNAQPLSPTVAGKDETGSQLNYNFDTLNIKAFDLPKGTTIATAPSPMVQASIGLFKDTEITGRWMPTVKIKDNNNIGFWGVGLKHGLKQWIPFVEKIPFLHLTLQGGYTRLTTNLGIEVSPTSIGLNDYNTLPNETWNDQNMMIQISSLTANLLISADIPFVSFYGGVGFVNTKSVLKLEGYYPMMQMTTSGPTVIASEKDPIDFQVKNQDGGVTKPRLNAGIRFKFGFFTMHFDYTRANYNVATAGIGITFR